MLATLASVVDHPLKGQEGPDSFNGLAALLGEPDAPVRDHAILAPHDGSHLALRKGKWVNIPARGSGGFKGKSIGDHTLGGPATHKLTLIVFSLLNGLAWAQDVPQRPNVLLIYVDDLGYNDLGCYGAKDPGIKTPNIDRLGAAGVRFTNYLSAGNVCSPSRSAVLTGRYPQRNGMPVCSHGQSQWPEWYENVGLPPSETTIAELLKPLGYSTAAYGKWHLGDGEKFAPWNQGFDEYVGAINNFPIGATQPWLVNREPQEGINFAQAHQKLTDAAIAFMKEQQQADKPFFIYLAHYLVHGPWSPNREFCSDQEWDSVQQQQGGMNPVALPPMVRELDHHVGLVLEAIRALGIEKRTLVIFASDNGPWLPAGSASPFSGGKFSTMEGGHCVPAMIRWPGYIPAGRVSDQMVSALEVLPTIAAAVDAPLPSDRKVDGYNIMPLLTGETGQSPRSEFAYYNGLTLEAVRKEQWKLHLPRELANRVYWANNEFDPYRNLGHFVLNNLATDSAENTNAVQRQAEKTVELTGLAERFRHELGDWNRSGTDRPTFTYPGNLNDHPKSLQE